MNTTFPQPETIGRFQFGIDLGFAISRLDQYSRRCYVDYNIPLPPGWEICQDPHGRVYYLDHDTMTSTWQRPNTKFCYYWEQVGWSENPMLFDEINLYMLKSVHYPQQVSAMIASHPEISSEPHLDGNPLPYSEPLPSGWEIRQRSWHHLYYIDHNNRTTTCIRPNKEFCDCWEQVWWFVI